MLTAYTPVWNDRGKALATNSFAYPKPGRQAAAIRAKGNKRRRQRGSLGGKLVFVVLNERSFEHDDDWSVRCLRLYCDRRSVRWRCCE
jgi:hypothetical protein